MSLVSIIMPVHNSENFLKRSISSVLAQTYDNWELIICDDNSTDNSQYILKAYSKNPKIILIRNEFNLGPAKARNRAIKKANGRFIAFLDSDDYWMPKKLEIQIAFMKKNSLSFSFTSYNKVNEEFKFISSVIAPQELTMADLIEGNKIGCLTAVYDKSILGKIYMPEYLKRQDWALWLLIHKKIKISKGINEVLGEYTVRNNSVSSNKLKLLKYHYSIYRTLLNFNVIQSLFFLIMYSFKKIWIK